MTSNKNDAIVEVLEYLTSHATSLKANNNSAEVQVLEHFINLLLLNQTPSCETLENILCINGWTAPGSFEGCFDFNELVQVLANSHMAATQPVNLNLASETEKILLFSPKVLMSSIGRHSGDLRAMSCSKQNMSCSTALAIEMLGLSSISNSLTSSGADGIDSIYGNVRDFINCITTTVQQHGGDVVSFEGVALLCLFSQEDDDLCTVRAFECGLELRDLVSGALSTRVAVCHGEVSLSVAGGQDDNWVCVLHGACVVELFACLSQAADHEMMSTPECCRRVTERLETLREDEKMKISRKQSFILLMNSVPTSFGRCKILTMHVPTTAHTLVGNTQFELSPPSYTQNTLQTMKLFIPIPILSAICSNSLQEMYGLRTVTTLYAVMSPNSGVACKDGKETDEHLQSLIATVQQVLLTSGGYLKTFQQRHDGWVLVIMWGLPFATFINNCARSVYCALSIKQHTELIMNWSCSTGISTGLAITGLMGSTARQDYMILGSDVHLAKSLMHLASNSLLISSATHEALPYRMQKRFDSKSVPTSTNATAYEYKQDDVAFDPSMMNDFSDSAKVGMLPSHVSSQVLSQLDKIFNSLSVQFAKEKEKTRLMMLMKRQASTSISIKSSKSYRVVGVAQSPNAAFEPIVTALIGGAGIGKTTAISFVLQRAKKLMLNCVHVLCSSKDQGKPFSMLGHILTEIIGRDNFETEEQQRFEIEKILYDIECRDLRAKDKIHMMEMRVKRMKALRVFLGLDWDDVAGHYKITSFNPFSDPEAIEISGEDIVDGNDKTFVEVLSTLLGERKTVICIDDAQYCDELSWRQLRFVLTCSHVPLAIFIASRLGINGAVVPAGPQRALSTKQSMSAMSRNSSQQNFSTYASAHYCPSEAYEGVFGKIDDDNINCGSSYMSILRHEACVVIELKSLNNYDVNEMLHRVLGDEKMVDVAVSVAIHDFTGGNPYWCNAVAHFIEQHGVEEFTNAVASQGDRHQALTMLVTARFEKLDFAVQAVAKTASVIGEQFTLKLLKAIAAPDLSDVAGCLDILSTNSFVTLLDSITMTYSFQNAVIRKTINALVVPKIASSLHFAIADQLETEGCEDYPILSFHYRLSGCSRYQALKYTVKAANKCLRLGAFAEAIAFLDTALPLAVTRPELRALSVITTQGMTLLSPPVGIGGRIRLRLSMARKVNVANKELTEKYSLLRDDIESTLKYMSAKVSEATAPDNSVSVSTDGDKFRSDMGHDQVAKDFSYEGVNFAMPGAAAVQPVSSKACVVS